MQIRGYVVSEKVEKRCESNRRIEVLNKSKVNALTVDEDFKELANGVHGDRE